MKRLLRWTNHIPIRWRLTLISIGVLTLLLAMLGIFLLFTAEQALLSDEATSLRDEARLAVKGIHDRNFTVIEGTGPPQGPLPPDFELPATVLVQRLSSASTNATILLSTGTVLVSSSNLPFTPLPVIISPERIQQTLANDQQGTSYLLVHDAQGNRQLAVLMPIVSNRHTVAILQMNTPTTTADEFLTTLRFVLLFGVIAALSIAMALTFPLVGAALHPLVDMERTSQRIAEGGDLSMRIETPVTDDEIGHLALSFNWMVSQLENAFKRQKQFVADVSHELRTPLTALSGSLEMFMIGADRGDINASRRLAHGMYAEVQRMHRLVEDLLALTRLDEGKMVLREDTIDLRILIEKIYDHAQQLASGQDIRIDIAPDIPLVCADTDRLQQVLLNVVDNALKYTPADGCVEISAFKADQATVNIVIRDSGNGIAPEALPYVFDRFYREDPSRSRLPQSTSGNGLGLAIAKELIEAQGGAIAINSTPEKGTTVTIRLQTTSTIPDIQHV